MPAPVLETTGRNSGERRTSMLTAPTQEGGGIVLVGSKGGDERGALWPRIVPSSKGYAGCEQRTDRDIPVVICTPK
jgi:hypothetical protein